MPTLPDRAPHDTLLAHGSPTSGVLGPAHAASPIAAAATKAASAARWYIHVIAGLGACPISFQFA